MQRPTSIEEVKERLANFRSEEAAKAASAFKPRGSDVFVSTYSKSGTTWMQQVVHQLRSGASTNFKEISEVVPWLESALDMAIDPDAEQPGLFRAFKCHLLYSDMPKGGRYITVFRNPVSVLPSFYHFFEGWWFEPGSISIDTFAHELYMQGSAAGRHWDHLIDWWPRKDQENTLTLCYEDMLAAPSLVPRVVADFLGITIDEALMSRVVEHSSRQYMLDNSLQFDEHLIREHRDTIWGLPPGGGSSKVVKQGVSKELTPELVQSLQAVWRESVGSTLGFENYAEFRQSLPNPLNVERG